MVLAAVLGAALNSAATRAYGLYLDGFDVISEPATPIRYGVDVESIAVSVANAGGVSSMSFVIDDPFSLVTVTDGMFVRFTGLGTGAVGSAPIFLGWVQSYTIAPAFGDQGRTITVQCIGVEAMLDWYSTTVDLAIDTAMVMADAIQLVIANAVGLGELRALAGTGFGTQAKPIAGTLVGRAIQTAITITAGTTIREACRQISETNVSELGYIGFLVTVDNTLGLRAFDDTTTFTTPDSDGSVAAGGATDSRVANLQYQVDASGVVRSVLVKGTGVSALITDGTGKAGLRAVIEDTTITSADAATQAGVVYLQSYRTGARGSFRLEGPAVGTSGAFWTPASVVIKKLALTDDLTGATGTYRIYQLEYVFYGSQADVTVAFGGFPPDVAALLRRLTRTTAA